MANLQSLLPQETTPKTQQQKTLLAFYSNTFSESSPLFLELPIPSLSYNNESIYEELWKITFILFLNLLKGYSLNNEEKQKLKQLNRQLHKKTISQSYQPIEGLFRLNNYLLDETSLLPHRIEQTQNGSAPLDFSLRSHLHTKTLMPFHIDLGIIWGLLGYFHRSDVLIESSKKIALWHSQTLDENLMPYPSLFTRENNYNKHHHLIAHYLLFKLVGRITEQGELESLADHILTKISPNSFFEQSQLETYLLIDTWIETTLPLPHQTHFNPTLHFTDKNNLLAMIKEEHASVFCTLRGSQTGLGSIQTKSTKIINFGPQALPLDQCHLFGLEDFLTLPSSHLETSNKTFKISGEHLRIANQPKETPFDTWMNISMSFQQHQLKIDTLSQKTKTPSPLAFSFFCQAHSCLIEGQGALEKHNLKPFEGLSRPVYLLNEEKIPCLKIHPSLNQLKMHVISLPENHLYWGASFLVAFELNPQNTFSSWTVSVLQQQT